MTEAKPTIRVIKKGQIGVLERPISANEQPKKKACAVFGGKRHELDQ